MTAKQLAKQVWLEWLKHSHMLPEQFTLVGYDPTCQNVTATYHAVSGRDTEMRFAVLFMLRAIATAELFEAADDVHLSKYSLSAKKANLLAGAQPDGGRRSFHITAVVVTGAVAICTDLKSLNVLSTAALVSGEFRSGIPR